MTNDTKTQAMRDLEFESHMEGLKYEVEVLIRLEPWLPFLAESDTPMLYVACFEACLLHARNLIEFLVGRKPQKGKTERRKPTLDIGANLLLPEWDDDLIRVNVDQMDVFCYQLDGALAHLSKRRIEDDGRPTTWVSYGMRLVHEALEQFVTELNAAGSSYGPTLTAALTVPEGDA